MRAGRGAVQRRWRPDRADIRAGQIPSGQILMHAAFLILRRVCGRKMRLALSGSLLIWADSHRVDFINN